MEDQIDVEIKSKVCSKCGESKSLDCFYFSKNRKLGVSSYCKNCDKSRKKIYEENNKVNYVPNKLNLTVKKCGKCKVEKDIIYFSKSKNRSDGLASQCKDCIAKNFDRYQNNNTINYVPNKYNLTNKKCCKCKLDKSISRFGVNKSAKDGFQNICYDCSNEHQKNKIKTDPIFGFKRNVSALVRNGLNSRGSSKLNKSFFKTIGYTPEQLMDHLMSHTDKELWMTEDNQGVYILELWKDDDPSTWVWHLDHIIPHSKFSYDSMNDPEFKKCWDLSNLRPYSAKKNIQDGNRRKINGPI